MPSSLRVLIQGFVPFLLQLSLLVLVLSVSNSQICSGLSHSIDGKSSSSMADVAHPQAMQPGQAMTEADYIPPTFSVTNSSLDLDTTAYDAVGIEVQTASQFNNVTLAVCIDAQVIQAAVGAATSNLSTSYYTLITWPRRDKPTVWNISLDSMMPDGSLCFPKNKQGVHFYTFPIERLKDETKMLSISVFTANSSDPIGVTELLSTRSMIQYFTLRLINKMSDSKAELLNTQNSYNTDWDVRLTNYEMSVTVRSLDAETFDQTGVYGVLRAGTMWFLSSLFDFYMSPLSGYYAGLWSQSAKAIPFRHFQMLKIELSFRNTSFLEALAPVPIQTINITDMVEVTRAPIASNLVLTWPQSTTSQEADTTKQTRSKQRTQRVETLKSSSVPLVGLYDQCVVLPTENSSDGGSESESESESGSAALRLSFMLTRVDPIMLTLPLQCRASYFSTQGRVATDAVSPVVIYSHTRFNHTAFGSCSFPLPPREAKEQIFRCFAPGGYLDPNAALRIEANLSLQDSFAIVRQMGMERVPTFNGTYQLAVGGTYLRFGLNYTLPPLPSPSPSPSPSPEPDDKWIADPKHIALVVCVTVIPIVFLSLGLLIYIKKKRASSSVSARGHHPPAGSTTNEMTHTQNALSEIGYGSTESQNSVGFRKL